MRSKNIEKCEIELDFGIGPRLSANGMLACLVGEFKVTLFGSSSKDDERKKAQIATKPQLGKLAVSGRH